MVSSLTVKKKKLIKLEDAKIFFYIGEIGIRSGLEQCLFLLHCATVVTSAPFLPAVLTAVKI